MATKMHFIGGAHHSGQTLPVINPHTERIVGEISNGGADEVDMAVRAARAAFLVWSKTPGTSRANILRRIARRVMERKQELAEAETMDMGKPIDESLWDIDDVAGCFDFYADRCEALFGDKDVIEQKVELPMEEFAGTLLKEPLGVVGAITPWNYPMLMATWKVAPALAAGCTVVLKPSEMASLTCLMLGEICAEAGLPAGALNIVTGEGNRAGKALCDHKGVDKIAFTGSLETGKAIMHACANDVKPLSLELGGKSALVIFEDCQIDKAVEWALFGCFWTNGQICSATSRVLVHESIAERFLKRLKQGAESIERSDPAKSGCRLGPVVSKRQFERVSGFIRRAKKEGIALLSGERKTTANRGYYIDPTIFVNVPTSSELWREEVFGPVMAVRTFSTEKEAVDIANASDFALAAAVITDDPKRRKRMARAFNTGIVWLNCSQPCFVQMPWGGRKRSGFGRDLGRDGLEKYLHQKQVVDYVSSAQWNWYPHLFSAKL